MSRGYDSCPAGCTTPTRPHAPRIEWSPFLLRRWNCRVYSWGKNPQVGRSILIDSGDIELRIWNRPFFVFRLLPFRANMFFSFTISTSENWVWYETHLPKLQASRQGWHQPMVTAQQCGLDQHLAGGKHNNCTPPAESVVISFRTKHSLSTSSRLS